MYRLKIFFIFCLTISLLLSTVPAASAQMKVVAPDATGVKTGTMRDIPAKTPGMPTLEEIADTAGHTKVSLNMVWILLAGALVMFMQAGFALVETGFVRVKNVIHTMAMNIVIFAVGVLGFWAIGFALMFGGIGSLSTLGGTNVLNNEFIITLFGKPFGLFGVNGFFLTGSSYDVAVFAFFIFQLFFMDAAATIPTGAMAERWKFFSFIIYGFFMSMLLYPVFGNWVWGGGWLAQLGANFGLGHGSVDFAGSSVVHMVGGWTALTGAFVLGPRIGKYKKNGIPNTIPGHNIPMVVLGAFVLAFGWMGFNGGSTLSGVDLRSSVVIVNTILASAAGAFSAMLYLWKKTGKIDIAMTVNGFLAGLVAVTGPCAFINAIAAVVIGLIAGVLVIWATYFVERTLKVDDVAGAVAVHGVNGAWGIVALGLFADGTYGDGLNGVSGAVRGLFYGDASQFAAQMINVFVCFLFVSTMTYAFFKALDYIVGMRVAPEAEVAGLDASEFGASGYPEAGVPEFVSPALAKVRRSAKVSLRVKKKARTRIIGRPAFIPVEE